MAQDAGQSLGVHTGGQRVGGEGMPEIMKPNVRQVGFGKDILELCVCAGGIDGGLRVEGIMEDPPVCRPFLGEGCG